MAVARVSWHSRPEAPDRERRNAHAAKACARLYLRIGKWQPLILAAKGGAAKGAAAPVASLSAVRGGAWPEYLPVRAPCGSFPAPWGSCARGERSAGPALPPPARGLR